MKRKAKKIAMSPVYSPSKDYEDFVTRPGWINEIRPQEVDEILVMLQEVFNLYRETGQRLRAEHSRYSELRKGMDYKHPRYSSVEESGQAAMHGAGEATDRMASIYFLMSALKRFRDKNIDVFTEYHIYREN